MTASLDTTPTQRAEARTPLSVILAIIAVSAAASCFLAWLVYYHHPVDIAGTQFAFLPSLNALFNAICTVFLIVAYRYIRQKNVLAHRNSMFGAFLVSCLFLASYIMNYTLHGEMRFPATHPGLRFFYLWILLLPHVALATFALPLILITFFLSLTGRFSAHRKVARWTFPMWLYVSVTGVVVYLMLAVCK